MARPSSIALSTGLIGAGALVCAMTAKPLIDDPSLRVPLNIFGINRSPYGEVFAMAMQGPIDQTFHHTFRGPASPPRDAHSPEDCDSPDCDAHAAEAPPVAETTTADAAPAAKRAAPFNARLRGLLEELDAARSAYTNPKPSSEAQKRHIRRDVEDKLRFAYQLDPANYGNYNAYHFFLTEPQLGTRPELTPGAARLAQETITYCLAESFDPRPALTAAAAATNILHLMFSDRQSAEPVYTTAHMRHTLNLLDHCMARHGEIHSTWAAAGGYDLLSPMRISEMEDRFTFIGKIRDAAEGAIRRFESEESAIQAQH